LKTHRSSAFFYFLAFAFLVACRAPQHRYPLTGDIVGMDRTTHQLIIRHEEIPNFMKAMTMPYQLRDPALLDRLQIGQRVKATLVVTETEVWLEDVQVIGQAPGEPSETRSQSQIAVEGQPVPDFVFTNQDGRRVHLAQYRGKAVLLTFIYTRCPLPDFCPRMTHNFLDVEKSLKQDPVAYSRTHLLSVSFDPEFDAPNVLRQHAISSTSIPADTLFSHWEFVAPRPQDLDNVAHFFGVTRWKENGQITHSLSTVIVDRDGKLYRSYHGNSWSTEELLREARTAAGGNSICFGEWRSRASVLQHSSRQSYSFAADNCRIALPTRFKPIAQLLRAAGSSLPYPFT
jgi:protein SCO1/2